MACGWRLVVACVASAGLFGAIAAVVCVMRASWKDVTTLERDEGRALEAWWRERHRRQALERGEDPDDGRKW